MMGSPASETGRKTDEGPQHEVTITEGYWIGKTEVTIGQWKGVMGETFREHVVCMLNDETIYDFGEQKQKLREYMRASARTTLIKLLPMRTMSCPCICKLARCDGILCEVYGAGEGQT